MFCAGEPRAPSCEAASLRINSSIARAAKEGRGPSADGSRWRYGWPGVGCDGRCGAVDRRRDLRGKTAAILAWALALKWMWSHW